MNLMSRRVALSAFLLAVATMAVAQPTITQINKAEIPRSGRVAIEGSGFGTDGEVFIAGLGAWTSTWTETRVVAYVPEGAPLGVTSLHVVVQGQQSNEVDLSITGRQADGRARWTFEADASNLWWRPALAPDGTVYLHTNNITDGLVYALSPDGGLLWIQKVNWYPYVPPSAGPDGALYVGSNGFVYRISPQGVIDWQYWDFISRGPRVAPTIGPDGLLYGAFEGGIGAFAMEPLTGQVVWSNSGNPLLSDKSGEATEMKFGPAGPDLPVDQLYVSVDGGAGFYAFSLDGDQLFTASLGNLEGTAEPAIGSDGTIYGPRAIGLVVAAVDPGDGSTLWEYDPPDWAVGTDNVEIGPDDILYFVGSGAKLEAFDPRTQSRRWQEFTPLDTLDRPTVTPDGSMLVLTGADTDVFGNPGFVKAFDAGNGHELWSFDLPFQLSPGFRVYGTHHPRITPDGTTAYVSTLTLAEWPLSQDPHAFLYAIDITRAGGPDPPANACNNDGICAQGEDCQNCPNDCPGKTSGNPSNRWCCGDGACSGAEDSFVCALDCGIPPVCGDGLCDPGENACACAGDCGSPPGDEIPGASCTDGVDNDCDGLSDCDDPGCAGSNDCLCGSKSASCVVDADCCSGVCKGNGRCR